MIAASKTKASGGAPGKSNINASGKYTAFLTSMGPPPSTGKEQRDPNSSTAAQVENRIMPPFSKTTPPPNPSSHNQTVLSLQNPVYLSSPRLPPPFQIPAFSTPAVTPKPSLTLVGMTNNGNTCYINSVLQSLYNLPNFSADLLDPRLSRIMERPATAQNNKASTSSGGAEKSSGSGSRETELWTAIQGSLSELKSRALAHSFRSVQSQKSFSFPFTNFYRSQGPTINPRRVKEAMTRTAPLPSEAEGQGRASLETRWASWRQQDAHEFLVALLDRLQGEVLSAQLRSKRASLSPIVVETGSRGEDENPSWSNDHQSKILKVAISSALCPGARSFSGCLQHTLRCNKCGHESHLTESINHISIQLPPPTQKPSSSSYDFFPSFVDDRPGINDHVTIQSLLKTYFEDESVDKMCDSCKASSSHLVSHLFKRLPHVLIVHVKRFQHEMISAGGSRYLKLHTRVEVGMEGPSSRAIIQLGPFCLQGSVSHQGDPQEWAEGSKEMEVEGDEEGDKKGAVIGGGVAGPSRGGAERGDAIVLDDEEEEGVTLFRHSMSLGQGGGVRGGGGGGLKGGSSPSRPTSRFNGMNQGMSSEERGQGSNGPIKGSKLLIDSKKFGYGCGSDGGDKGAQVDKGAQFHRAMKTALDIKAPFKSHRADKNNKPPPLLPRNVNKKDYASSPIRNITYNNALNRMPIDLTGNTDSPLKRPRRSEREEEEDLQRAIAASLEDEEDKGRQTDRSIVMVEDGYEAEEGPSAKRRRRRGREGSHLDKGRSEVGDEDDEDSVNEIEVSPDPSSPVRSSPPRAPQSSSVLPGQSSPVRKKKSSNGLGGDDACLPLQPPPGSCPPSSETKALDEEQLAELARERAREEAARYLDPAQLVEDGDFDNDPIGVGPRVVSNEGGLGADLDKSSTATTITTTITTTTSKVEGKGTRYELRGAILHRGKSPQSGHYVTLMSIPPEGTWCCFNDEQVEQVGQKRVNDEVAREGYILYYSLLTSA